jgi:hypothetical protein
LRRFDGLIAADGAVVLFGDDRTGVPASDWSGAYRAIVARYAEGDEERPRRADGPRGHIPVLLGSAFNRLEQISVFWTWSFGAETLIERALSKSGTSRARLGERADEMVAELRAAIPGWSSDGTFTEVVASSALIARRPG